MSGAAFHPRVSLHLASGWNWSLDEHLAFLTSEGVPAITVTAAQVKDNAEDAIARIRASGVAVTAYATANGSLIDGEEAALAQLQPIIDMAAALGAPTAIGMTGPTPSRMPTAEACDRLVASLGAARDYARSKGVTLAFEHSSPTLRQIGFVTSLTDLVTVAGEAGIGVVVETQNCWYERNVSAIFRNHIDRIAAFQCSDFVVGEELRMNRRVPGDGDMPLEWMMGEVLDAGYAGKFDLEIVGPAIEKEGYASAFRRGLDWMSERLDRWGA
ncbi:MAG: sugar phosphate isomerase/epimerase [Novosphingobium sp.]|nr:sugar phosphate isomerase/epimerase [Novosphingobium sp.]